MLTAERVRDLLHYAPATGVFTWKVNRGGKAKAGGIAGSLDDGYIKIGIDGRIYRAHRLAWLYMTGMWPTKVIDHEDERKENNTWNNLREATHAQNQHNQGKKSFNTSGFKGVDYKVGKWRARVTLGAKQKHIGYFDTAEEAYLAYCTAATELHGEFANHGQS